MNLMLYNTLTRKIEQFKPLIDNEVRMYTCGPTVYDYPHIGNLRSYIFADVLKRTLLFNGYNVKHVMNITDVGHLTSDADEGEDKLEKGAARENKTVWDIVNFYTAVFKENIKDLNIQEPEYIKATERIKEQQALIKKLEQKRFTYDTPEAVYFDVTKFPDYTRLARQPLEEKLIGARSEVHVDTHKKHPQDFALWFKRVGRFKDHAMHWPSPWGDGFPGWHIECSAISMSTLGDALDIHTGGVDHIPVHHTNEIAQSEGATGTPFARFWMHGEFLLVDGKKMSKSAGTFITLDDIKKRGFHPLAFRLLCLQAHYRSKLNFTWESLEATQHALDTVYNTVKKLGIVGGEILLQHSTLDEFKNALNNDLNTPQAIGIFFDTITEINATEIDELELILKMDDILGLGLKELPSLQKIEYKNLIIESDEEIPENILDLLFLRRDAQYEKNWREADELREKIKNLGYTINDGRDGIVIKKL